MNKQKLTYTNTTKQNKTNQTSNKQNMTRIERTHNTNAKTKGGDSFWEASIFPIYIISRMLALCADSLFLYRSPQRSKQNKHKTRQTNTNTTITNPKTEMIFRECLHFVMNSLFLCRSSEWSQVLFENVCTLYWFLYSFVVRRKKLNKMKLKQTNTKAKSKNILICEAL